MNLVVVEMRRALHRRAIRVLILLALVGCAFAGVVAWFGSAGKTLAELSVDEEGSPAIMTDWWIADANEGFLALAMFFLFLGAFMAGATYAGGEWRAGTVGTVLTWEPRRLRLHAARTTSAAILALVISFGLQIVFLASFMPSVWAHGTTDGVGGPFWTGLVVAMARTSVLTSLAAVLGVALATLGRNTAFAVITAFAWMAVVENLLRGLRPSLAPWLCAENLGTVMTWSELPDTDFSRGPGVALLTLTVYGSVFVVAGAISFDRRDITAT